MSMTITLIIIAVSILPAVIAWWCRRTYEKPPNKFLAVITDIFCDIPDDDPDSFNVHHER